ncbi:tautomerase family protein [Tatumella citrea]|uniref:4-oxalocrotonate tautomerase n=1 Tax=Tatumella citrea TaxID=53336 RepID=A0A1Y0LJ24_TATCI|nr:tautomerase family protein [Tatumella citrea]ARU93757.1 4-oxalocrotonate tautomerase [Tatumella citrea]ARU97795.1 4-oxalocrotonate tautomerase [Tatumella citrea]
MPEVVVNLAEGRTPEQKEQLMQGIYQVVRQTLGVADEFIVVSLVEVPKQHKTRGGIPYDKL